MSNLDIELPEAKSSPNKTDPEGGGAGAGFDAGGLVVRTVVAGVVVAGLVVVDFEVVVADFEAVVAGFEAVVAGFEVVAVVLAVALVVGLTEVVAELPDGGLVVFVPSPGTVDVLLDLRLLDRRLGDLDPRLAALDR